MDFSIDNIPFGVALIDGKNTIVSAYLENVIILKKLNFPAKILDTFHSTILNDFMNLGREAWREARSLIQNALRSGSVSSALVPLSSVEMVMPVFLPHLDDDSRLH